MCHLLEHKVLLRRGLGLVGIFILIFGFAACSPIMASKSQPPVSTLRVVMDNNYPPYVFLDDQGKLQGILIDEWNLWQKYTGVKVEITALPWSEAYERMKSGEFDVIDTIFYRDDRAPLFDFTGPYAQINVRIFFQKNISGIANVEDLKGFRVAVKRGDADVDYLKDHGIDDLIYYDSYESIIQAAKNKDVNIFVIDEPPAFYFLYKYGLQDQFNYSEPLEVGGAFHRAVHKGNEAILALVEDGFSRIKESEYQEINNRWFGSSLAANFQQLMPYLTLAGVLAALIILVLFVFNRTLQSRVQARTLDLQVALNDLQESEAHFRDAIEFFPIPVSIANKSGGILSLNRKFVDMYGYSLEDIPSVSEWMSRAYPDPEYRSKVQVQWDQDVAEASHSGTTTPLREYKVTCKDGTKCDVEIVMHPIGDLWVTSFNNITERKQVADALRENRRFLADLIEYSGALIYVKDRDGRYELINRKWEEVAGLKREEVIGNTDEVLFPGHDGQQFRKNDLEVLETGRVLEKEETLEGKTKRYFLSVKFPVHDENGNIRGICGMTTEITERKIAEEALRENEVIFSSFLEHSPVYVFFKDKNIRSLRLSRNYEKMLGMPIEAALGKSMDELFPSDLSKSMVADDLRILRHGERVDVIEELNGRIYETTKFPVMKDGSPFMLAGFTLDITERRKAEEALRESEENYRNLVELSPDTIMVHCDGKIVFMNSAGLQLIHAKDASEVLGLPAISFVHPDQRAKIVERIQKMQESGERARPLEEKFVRLDGSVVDVEVVAMPIHYEGRSAVQVVARDITERKRAADIIQQSEKRFRTLIEHSADALTLLSANGTVLYEGPTVIDITGFSPEERVGKSGLENIFPADLPLVKETFAYVLAAPGNSATAQFRSVRKDGSIYWTEGTATNLLHDPNVQAIVINYRDITVRKKAEEKLRESEQRNRAIVAALPDLLFEFSSDGRFLDCIASDPERLLVPPQQAIGHRVDEILPAKLATMTFEKIQQTLSENRMQIYEYSLNSSQVAYYESRMTPLGTNSVLALVRDITEAKRVEQELRQSEQRYRTLFDQANDAIFIENLEDQIVDVNQRACQMLGYTREELLRMRVPDLIDPEIHRGKIAIRQELSKFGAKPFESRDVCKDGSIISVEVTNSVLPKGFALSIVRDITERKKAEEALRRSEAEVRSLNIELEKRVAERTAQLESTNKELEAFSYSVSHDLRAPLRAIDGFSRIVQEDYALQLGNDGQKLLMNVRKESQRMAQLIDALLNLSRMSRAELHNEVVDLSALAHQVLNGLRQSQPQRQVECVIAGNMTGHGDARLLNIVLENILGNAWKFTSKRERGYIEFGTIQQPGNEQVYFVRDNGAGFDPAYIDKLFGAFQRLHRADEFEGTGIGLATVQRIINRHGGRVWAEAELDKGATFYFTLG